MLFLHGGIRDDDGEVPMRLSVVNHAAMRGISAQRFDERPNDGVRTDRVAARQSVGRQWRASGGRCGRRISRRHWKGASTFLTSVATERRPTR